MSARSLVCHTLPTPLGSLWLAASDQGLCGAWFEGQKDFPDTRDWHADPNHSVLRQAAQQLREYFAGQRRSFDVPLHFAWGTPFQQTVWRALLAVAYGQTCSYSDIARQAQRPQAVRAVGGAIGKNPISILVPCHRVVGRNGALTGYTGGLDRKRALLALEQGHRA